MCGRNIEKMMGAVALAAVTLSLLMAISAMPLALAQEPVGFEIRPGDFTVRDAPPLGEPYLLEQKLVIGNGDNIKRIFIISALVPENLENLTLGYTAIPDNSWIVPIPQVIEVDENLPGKTPFGEVEIYLNIPRQENLTSQKWEAWISVKRQAEIGEVLEPVIICRARIETSAELPPPPEESELPIALILAAVVIVVGASLGAWAWWRRKRVKKGHFRGHLSR